MSSVKMSKQEGSLIGGGAPRQEAAAKPKLELKRAAATSWPPSLSMQTSSFASLLLPLLFILLLPSIKLGPPRNSHQDHHHQDQIQAALQRGGSGLLLELVRLPLDRLRLGAGLLAGVSAAVQLQQRQPQRPSRRASDLLEEETQLQAEHRGLPAGSQLHLHHQHPHQQHQQQHHHQRNPQRAAELAPAPSSHSPAGYEAAAGGGHLEAGASEYGGAPGEAEANGPVGSVVEATEGGGGASGGSPMGAMQARADLPAVRALNVKCEKNHMTVNIVFDRPFYGLVFSKGHYSDQKCVHLPANSGQTSVNFDIHLGKCGMSSSEPSAGLLGSSASSTTTSVQNNQQQQPNGFYIENTIIIQYDPQVQEIYDQARKLRCTWYDYYEKSVTFRPYNVDMLDAVTANFLGDNIQCWMQIQTGKGPWSSEVAGIVKIGQTMTMVLAIKDDESKFDMLVRNCVAHDGRHQPIQLVDEYGCVARPKIMGKFQKSRSFGPAATVVSYAHFQAFKFPDSMSVHFQCVIQVCRHQCPEPVCSGSSGSSTPSIEADAASPGAPQADYAVSGTEIVSSKEPPVGTYLLASSNTGNTGNNAGNHSALNFHLDESMGRVQVKLDTTMLAPGGRPTAPSGALPPHLLHTVGQQQQELAPAVYAAPARPAPVTAGAAHLSSSPYPPRPLAPQRAPGGGGGNGRPPIVQLRAGSPTTRANGAAHFSPPYPAASLLHHRLGDLMPAPSATSDASQLALSFIGQPRALNLAAAGVTRKRRAIPAAADQAEQSTAIRTQKTIQVVSPEDMAFSLADPVENLSQVDRQVERTLTGEREATTTATVCVSAARLAAALLVTLATLATSVVIVAYVLLNQRRRQKLDNQPHHLNVFQQQQQQQQVQQHSRRDPRELARDEEMRRRQTYLARLYAQFTPAHYWPQAAAT